MLKLGLVSLIAVGVLMGFMQDNSEVTVKMVDAVEEMSDSLSDPEEQLYEGMDLYSKSMASGNDEDLEKASFMILRSSKEIKQSLKLGDRSPEYVKEDIKQYDEAMTEVNNVHKNTQDYLNSGSTASKQQAYDTYRGFEDELSAVVKYTVVNK